MTFGRTFTAYISERDNEIFARAHDLIVEMAHAAEGESVGSHWSWVDEATGECITDSDIPRLLGALSFLADNKYLIIGD